jgi:uncharacterized protein
MSTMPQDSSIGCARASMRLASTSGKVPLMDARLLEILACPVCKGPLLYRRDQHVLVCRLDRLAYPIRDDVPVMLEEEARQLAADDVLLER